jgi:hypothetical protein
VPSGAIVKVGCAVGKRRLRNIDLIHALLTYVTKMYFNIILVPTPMFFESFLPLKFFNLSVALEHSALVCVQIWKRPICFDLPKT